QLVDRPELDRLGRTRLGAGRDQAVLLAVVAEGTLAGVAGDGAAGDDPERTGRDAVRAAVTDVRLNVDVAELVVDDRPGRAGLLARGRRAVLAHVRHHQPSIGERGCVGVPACGSPPRLGGNDVQ